MKKPPFTPKQVEFIANANTKFNLAHGAVRSGKTVCTIFAFIKAVVACPGESIAITGFSQATIYNNIIALLFHSEELSVFRPFCTWHKGNQPYLMIGNKKIRCIGASDEGAIGQIQGSTLDLVYCDEMTLYPDNVIEMIRTRLSRDHSKLFASMNPKQPDHPLRMWIEEAIKGNPLYYQLHFALEDNTFLSKSYIDDIKRNISGVFYKRNVLGLWCLAEGAVYDFFDHKIHVTNRPPCADYFIAGIDYGTRNPTACLVIGVHTGVHNQTGKKMFVEKEYYWDPSITNRQKTNTEFADDLVAFLEPYGCRTVYIDPSAASFRLELQRRGIHVADAYNDVLDGIQSVASLMQKGALSIRPSCKHLIKEIEGYVWDSKKAKQGEDAPLKVGDHACDALRYAVATHKIAAPRAYEPEPNYINKGYYTLTPR